MGYEIGDERVMVDDVGLECRWVGPAPDVSPTIVMLHEGLGCVAMWRDFPERLARATGCGVFVYSRAGYGASDPIELPRPLTFLEEEATQMLPKLLDVIGFQRGILLGHSDGASISTIYSGSVEDHRIHGLVLYAPHFFVEDVTIKSIEAARVAYETGDLRGRLAKYHGENVDCAFLGWNDAWLAPRFKPWEILDAVAQIRVPILIVQGANDEYGTLAQLRKAEERATCPIQSVVLDDCAHVPHLNQRERTLAETSAFLKELMAMYQARF